MQRLGLLMVGLLCCGWMPHGYYNPVLIPSQRSILNMNFIDFTYEYAFIDHVVNGGSAGLSPVGTGSFASPGYWNVNGNPTWATGSSNANLDAQGWPQNYTAVNSSGLAFGNHIFVPASSNYGAVSGHGYVIQWSGDCQLTLNTSLGGSGTITWSNDTLISGSNYTRNSNGNWQGTNVQLAANLTNTGNQEIGWRITNTGQFTGAYCHGLHIYRQDDQTDFNNGLIFRAAWKNILLVQDASAIRFMNWHGGAGITPYRWENRAPFPNAVYGGAYANVSLPYGDTGGSNNSYTLAGVTGTPAAMQHGEIVTTRLNASMVNSQSGGYAVSAIAQCAPGSTCTCGSGSGQVTTSSAYPFNVGDPIVFVTSSASGMTQINYYNTTVGQICDATHFNTTINTTSFSAFTSGHVDPYVSLNLAGLGAYPIMDPTGTIYAGEFGSANYFHINDVRNLVFDKTISGSRNGSGNLVPGVWISLFQTDNGTPAFFQPAIQAPIEVCATLIKELNALSPVHPIDMYLNLPDTALSSMDPDYLASSNYTYNAVNLAKSIIPNNRHIFLEVVSNECWHANSDNFPCATYYEQRALLRANQPPGITGQAYMYGLRAVVASTDIVAQNGVDPRVHFILAGQGAVGISSVSGQPNYSKAFGGPLFYEDAVVQALTSVSKTGNTHTNGTIDGIASVAGLYQGWGVSCAQCAAGTQITAVGTNSITVSPSTTGTASSVALTLYPPPISYMWGWAFASYFDVPASYMTASGTGSFTDDSAMYAGTSPYSSPNQAQAIANFVTQLTTCDGTGCSSSQSTALYESLATSYSAAFSPIGAYTIEYEGAQDWQTAAGSIYQGHTITSADQLFLLAVQGSANWSTALQAFFTSFRSNTLTVMPALYVMVDESCQWGYVTANCTTSNPDDYSGGVEGGALNTPWTVNGTVNQGLQ
jgi:hypothetical protein